MFKVGDKAKVVDEIRRKDGMSVVYPGETVLVTQVFNSETKGVQIVAIQPLKKRGRYSQRLPLLDIVVKNGRPLIIEY